MELGLIGLGKMGGNMAQRIRNAGHTVVGYDQSDKAPRDVSSLSELVDKLSAPRVVWVMVPAGKPTDDTVHALGDLLSEGDTIVDGGNSKYFDDARHAQELSTKGIRFVDAGVSGGIWGLKNGYALMVGGADEDVARVQPIFDALKPEGESGFVHAGSKPGAGHFAKMVHNGIEYGIMQAYAEGYELMAAEPIIENVTETFKSWQQGTVIRSWLLDLAVLALGAGPRPGEDPRLRRRLGRGPLDGRGRHRQCGAAAGDHRCAVRPVRLSPGRFAGHEDGRRAAQPVRRSRGRGGRQRRCLRRHLARRT